MENFKPNPSDHHCNVLVCLNEKLVFYVFYILLYSKKQQHTTLPSFTQGEITDDDYINDCMFLYMYDVYSVLLIFPERLLLWKLLKLLKVLSKKHTHFPHMSKKRP